MSQTISFQRGNFQKFVATREISFGNIRPPHGYKATQGEIIEFDGFQVRIGSGESVESPSTRGAITGGWLVLASEAPPMAPRVTVAPAQRATLRPVVQYEDQIVAERSAASGTFHKAGPAPAPSPLPQGNSSLADRVLNQMRASVQPAAPVAPVAAQAPTRMPQAGRKPQFQVVRQEELENEGIPIATLRPKKEASQEAVSLGEGVVEDQRMIGRIDTSVRTGAPLRMEDTAKVRKSVTDSIIVGDKATIGSQDATHPSLRRQMAVEVEEQGGQTVGRVRTPTQFTGQVSATTDVRTQISKLEAQARIVPGKANQQAAPIPAMAPSDPRSHLKVRGELRDNLVLGTIQYFIPGFTWNKSRRVDERVKDALRYAEDPELLKGIYVYESEEVQAQILQAVPDLLTPSP